LIEAEGGVTGGQKGEELFIKPPETGSLPYPKGLLPVGRGLCE
jgi:hypothetical protein